MIPGIRWFGRAMTVLGALLLLYALWLLGDTGSFDPVPEGAASCLPVETGLRVSDAALDAEMGVAYIAGFDDEEDPPRGALYVLDLRAGRPLLLPMMHPDDLRPAGLGLYRGGDGRRSLFVIDRHPGAPRVKIFDVDGASATHRETISDPAFRTLNDIAPAGPRQFYATNDHRRGVTGLLQTLFRVPSSEILYFDGTLSDPVATDLITARGLMLNGEGGTLAVAEGLAHRLRIYRRTPETGRLQEERRIDLPAIPDKINPDAEGRLWLTGQTRLFRLFLSRLGARVSAPSQILTLDPATGTARTLHAGGGPVFRDARVALSGEGVVIAASPAEPKLLICRRD